MCDTFAMFLESLKEYPFIFTSIVMVVAVWVTHSLTILRDLKDKDQKAKNHAKLLRILVRKVSLHTTKYRDKYLSECNDENNFSYLLPNEIIEPYFRLEPITAEYFHYMLNEKDGDLLNKYMSLVEKENNLMKLRQKNIEYFVIIFNELEAQGIAPNVHEYGEIRYSLAQIRDNSHSKDVANAIGNGKRIVKLVGEILKESHEVAGLLKTRIDNWRELTLRDVLVYKRRN